tara:strand:- start:185 stop:493 length:309 start_codon:yes stop_codon:yes gene_type:complete
VLNAISFFDVTRSILEAEFAAIAEAPPGAFDWRLYEDSLDHSEDLLARDSQDHNGQFGKLRAHGFQFKGARASVFSYSRDPVHAHAGFNIDCGNDNGDGSSM